MLVKHFEFRKVCKNGSVIWVKEAVRVVPGSDGIPLALIVCEDINERKLTEKALRESEGRFRSVAQSANDAIISADDRGLIVSWNKWAYMMFVRRAFLDGSAGISYACMQSVYEYFIVLRTRELVSAQSAR